MYTYFTNMYIKNRANEHLYRNDTDNPLWHWVLTLTLLTWRIWWTNNASKWQVGFNSAFEGLTLSRGLNILFHKMYNKADWCQ